ncbi:HesA/MoeB/ThiF family protein [Methanosphaerula palustris]|uniref:UBA/THIF-type NAD/FAD binding protein n=1 Tax=Methanosphaerula palustris (strain ATCC BAA-1556 / DSM 19958 / E1-9c) TaxID=521011 RepID=B8GH79_METPE|nr:molybdopterin-synthase adenylyltransferase MoeB [Methanosphaerula palustris]ACL16484.1 UBA/THIF-type NAD/FAD binding protein [Methanosphaerula palustris E1-9c]
MKDEQIERYSRNIILKEVGGKGQERLLQSKVLIIGAGGLGSPAALYLAAAGVGTIGIVDGDRVDLSNLQRQVIHFTADVGTYKADSARDKITQLNPDVTVQIHKEMVSSSNIREIITDYDFIIDGTDNFPAKFLINDACILLGKPFSHAGILRFNGQTTTVIPDKSACYRCIFNTPPPVGTVPSCSESGVIGSMAGVIGTLQAMEAIKYLLGIGDLLTNRLLVFEALPMNFREIKIKKNPKCPVCGEHPTITSLIDYEQKVCELRK